MVVFLTERLVCPITNGTLVRPTPLLIDEEQSRQSPNGPQIRTLEFDISKNHLDTIVERNDLDIVVASHLFNEPLQVCHWPAEALQIRFNGTILQLDRSTTSDGSPAHKVCGIKTLCHPTKNTLEVFLSPSNRLCQPGCSLSVSSGFDQSRSLFLLMRFRMSHFLKFALNSAFITWWVVLLE